MMYTVQMGRETRVLARTRYDHGCWTFTGYLDRHGYGHIGIKDGKTRLAHRTVYIELVGDPGPEFVLDHLCRNPACVNPMHMEPTSIAGNVFRGANKRDHLTCKQGHEYTDANTAHRVSKAGIRKRVCLTCNKAWQAKYKAKVRR